MDIDIPSIITCNVEVSSTAVAYVVGEVVLPLGRQRSLVSLPKHHPTLRGLWFGFEPVHCIVTEQSSIIVLDVGVSSSSISAVVDNLPFHWTN